LGKKLSGKGDIGTTCPKCNSPLELDDQEYVGSEIIDRVRCVGCFACFSVHFAAVDWVEFADWEEAL